MRLTGRTHTRLQRVYFDGPVRKPISVLCILTEILSRAHDKGMDGLINSLSSFFFYYFLSVFLYPTKTLCRKRLSLIVTCVSSYWYTFLYSCSVLLLFSICLLIPDEDSLSKAVEFNCYLCVVVLVYISLLLFCSFIIFYLSSYTRRRLSVESG